MPRAEVGSLKHLSNQMKSRGLQRLRWYCTPCGKQCRDENGFKCHTMSESHVRNMQTVGQNQKSFIDEYSGDFKRDFLQLLRTSHGTKSIHINRFYQEYIGNKEHVHMNVTKWKSLTEFAKYLGREGICKVEENEKGIHIAWIDRSPEAMRRQEAVRRKERQQQGDQKLEEMMMQKQVERAQQAAAAAEAAAAAKAKDEPTDATQTEKPKADEKMTISFGFKLGPKSEGPEQNGISVKADKDDSSNDAGSPNEAQQLATPPSEEAPQAKPAMKMSFGAAPNGLKPKNGLRKGNALSAKRPQPAMPESSNKKMSEVERIMREGMDADRKRKEGQGFGERAMKRTKF